jgi:hypothetical protein
VIGFVYSGFQLYALMHHKRKQKHIIHRPLGDYFDFIMDQVLKDKYYVPKFVSKVYSGWCISISVHCAFSRRCSARVELGI